MGTCSWTIEFKKTLGCTLETNKMLYVNNTSIKKKKKPDYTNWTNKHDYR